MPSLDRHIHADGVRLRGPVLVVALVVRILRGVRDHRNAGYADGVQAHRLRLGATRVTVIINVLQNADNEKI